MKPPKSRKAELAPTAVNGEKSHAETAESAEFKMTELGLIPVDWEVAEISDLYEVRSSKRVFQSQWRSSGIPFYRARDIVGFRHGEQAIGGLFIDKALYEKYKRDYGVPSIDDLLVTAVGTLGNVFRVSNESPFYFKDGNIIWFKSKGKYDSRLLEVLFESGFLDSQIYDTAGGSTVGTYTISNAKKTLIPLPPLAEQRRIAGALSDVDELISALGKLIEKKRNIKTGAMQEFLTGKTRLPGFKGKWVEKCIGDMTCVVTGATPSTAREDFWGGSIRWMSSGELNYKIVAEVEGRITKEGFEACSTHIIPVGCVLIGLAGQGKTRGTAAYNLVEMCTNQSIASILPTSSFHSKFLYYYMDRQYDELRLISAGDGGRGGLTKGDIEKFSIRIPPTLAEQQAIAAVLSDMDAEIAALEADRAKYERIKSGMMQELLTGKTRLKP